MALQIQNLQVSIEDKEILHGVSLTINPGEIHAVMGPNGSGKSTLAATLAGHPHFMVHKESQVLLDGENILELTPDERARKGLFLAFQYPSEVPGVSVQNFLRALWEARFGPLAAPHQSSQRQFKSVLAFRHYLQEEAERLHVNPELLKRNLNEGFSGGERKRLEILQMSLFQPKFAILDETDSGLDIDAIKAVAFGIKSIIDQYNTGVLLITHYQRILQFVQNDYTHVLAHGRIAESGGRELAEKLEKSGYQRYTTV